MIVSDEIYQRLQPMKAIKEELGGGYYWRCPYMKCGKIVRSTDRFCSLCGQALLIDVDDYTKDYYKER